MLTVGPIRFQAPQVHGYPLCIRLYSRRLTEYSLYLHVWNLDVHPASTVFYWRCPLPIICTCRVPTCASRTKGASPYQHHNPEYQGMRNGRRRRRLNPFLPYTFHICCCLIPRCLAAARPSLPSFLLSFRRTLPEGFHRIHPRPWNIG
jgi:hypothetical protein